MSDSGSTYVSRFVCLVTASTLLAAGASSLHALEELPEPEDEAAAAHLSRVAGDWRVRLLPTGDLFPRALADPRRPRTGIALGSFDSDIPEAGELRFLIDIGAPFRLLRLTPPEGGTLQLDAEVGFFGHFDLEHSLDNIGWDGWYALRFSHDLPGPLSWRVSLRHLSAHVGDEFIERTGRRRIGYTREDLQLGIAWTLPPDVDIYLGSGYAHSNSADRQEPGMMQAGIQHQRAISAPDRPDALFGHYAGLDVQLFEENDWRPSWSLRAGFSVHNGDLAYRLGLEAYSGRSPLGEFTADDEDYLALSFTIDL